MRCWKVPREPARHCACCVPRSPGAAAAVTRSAALPLFSWPTCRKLGAMEAASKNSDLSSAQAIAKQEAATAAGVQLNWADQLKAAYAEAHAAGEIRVPPVIYSSRTHSQLAQVLRELKRTSYR